jgi:hypothetical protein
MTIGSIGKALASQAIESTKSTVMDAVRQPDPAKPGEAKPAIAQDAGTVILGQIQAMQRPLKDDQELVVTFRAGDEMLRVTEIFVPNPQVLVFAGVDKEGHVTRVISPVDSSQVICKVMAVTPGFNAIRVNVLTPKPQPKPAA